MPQSTSGDAAALGMVLAFLEVAGCGSLGSVHGSCGASVSLTVLRFVP